MSEQNTPTLSEQSESYIDEYLEYGGDLNSINPEALAGAFRSGYVAAVTDVIKIISTRPFAMNLQLLKDTVQKLPQS